MKDRAFLVDDTKKKIPSSSVTKCEKSHLAKLDVVYSALLSILKSSTLLKKKVLFSLSLPLLL